MANIRQDITAIIYDKKGRVLSIGKNSYTKTHTLQHHHANKVGLIGKDYQHAEVAAIVKCKDLSKAYSIHVTRVKGDGSYGLAKPCPICLSAISTTPIKIITHT